MTNATPIFILFRGLPLSFFPTLFLGVWIFSDKMICHVAQLTELPLFSRFGWR